MRFFRRDFIKRLVGLLGLIMTSKTMSTEKKQETKLRKVKLAGTNDRKHWVGDGFHVHGLLQPAPELYPFISPFLMMDYAAPKHFESSNKPKGVGEHPHRGFETVTFAYQGEVEHRDSAGGGGIIKPGDVQWMTAGSGVVHDEFHSKEFTKKGGIFEMVQLWVNLPKKDKMTSPKYQALEAKDIKTVKLGQTTNLRVIAGQYEYTKGPASTYSRINVFDLTSSGETLRISLEDNTNTILLVMDGQAEVEGTSYPPRSLIIFEREGDAIEFKTSKDFKALILNGEPIDEPVAAHGPFVMNTKEEIMQAIQDFQSGKMGRLN